MKRILLLAIPGVIGLTLVLTAQQATGNLTALASAIIDFSTAGITRPMVAAASDPATCTAGKDMYINTASTPKVRLCTTTNTWSDVGGGGSSVYAGSAPSTSAISMTGSDVTIQTIFNVPALAAGGCYVIDFQMLTSSAATAVMLYRDSTTSLGQVGGAGGGPNLLNGEFRVCNNPGVQNAQTMYSWVANFCGANPCSNAQTNINGFTWPVTPTATDWTTSHSLAIKANAASGTVTGLIFSVRATQ